MRCSSFLAAAVAVVLAFAAPQTTDAVCAKYAGLLGVPQIDLMNTLITRVVFGTKDISSSLGGATGTFLGLRKITSPPRDVLDVVSTANFGTTSMQITLFGSQGDQIVGAARRPNNGLYYFLDQAGQLYSGDVDTAIRTFNPNVTITPIGPAVAARATGSVNNGIGFAFNPMGDRIRITNGARNFRVNPNNGLAGNPAGTTGVADGTDEGNTFSYQTPLDSAQAIALVATAYTNQVANATSTVQYGIDAGNNRVVRFNNSNSGIIGSNVPLTFAEPNGAAALTVNTGLTYAGSVLVASITRTVNSVANDAIYTINTATGVATPLGGGLAGTAYRAIVFTPAVGPNGIINPSKVNGADVAGIAGTPEILGFFNLSTKFKDGQEDYTSGQPLIDLRDKLVKFFAGPLGCTTVAGPSAGAPSQYTVHQGMNINQNQFDLFNQQVANTALSFGIPGEELAGVPVFLNSFLRQTVGTNSKAICIANDCKCADGYGPAGNCQTFTGSSTTTSSSSTGAPGGTTPGGDGPGAASGLSAPFALVAALAVVAAALRA